MNLFRNFSKIMTSNYYIKYLLVAFSIVLSYLIISVTTVYADNILVFSSESVYSEMRYLYISILTIFSIAGLSLILYQYLNIIKSSMRDYCLARGLRVTKHNIRMLILLQVVLLIIVSLPVGLLCGYLLTEAIISLIGNVTRGQQYIWSRVTSTTTLFFVAGVISSLIIAIGVYLDLLVRKKPIDNILSDSFLVGKEG